MEIIYTTQNGLYSVAEKNGLFYPQYREFYCAEFGKIDGHEATKIRNENRFTVHETPWSKYFLGDDCRGKSKGFKNYKSLKSAQKFVDAQ
jgi:hypothetical protein